MLAKSLLFVRISTERLSTVTLPFCAANWRRLGDDAAKARGLSRQPARTPWTRPRLWGLLFSNMRSFLAQAEMQNWAAMCLRARSLGSPASNCESPLRDATACMRQRQQLMFSLTNVSHNQITQHTWKIASMASWLKSPLQIATWRRKKLAIGKHIVTRCRRARSHNLKTSKCIDHSPRVRGRRS